MKTLLFFALALTACAVSASPKKCVIDGKTVYSSAVMACPGEEQAISGGTVSGMAVDTSRNAASHAIATQIEVTKKDLQRNDAGSTRRRDIKSLR